MCQYELQSHSMRDWKQKLRKKKGCSSFGRSGRWEWPRALSHNTVNVCQWHRLCESKICTKQHIFIKGWEVPLIQEWQKSDLGNTTHSSSSICTRKRYRNCYFTHWKSLEKASIRRKRKWRHFFSWEWSLFNPLKQSGRGQEYFL